MRKKEKRKRKKKVLHTCLFGCSANRIPLRAGGTRGVPSSSESLSSAAAVPLTPRAASRRLRSAGVSPVVLLLLWSCPRRPSVPLPLPSVSLCWPAKAAMRRFRSTAVSPPSSEGWGGAPAVLLRPRPRGSSTCRPGETDSEFRMLPRGAGETDVEAEVELGAELDSGSTISGMFMGRLVLLNGGSCRARFLSAVEAEDWSTTSLRVPTSSF